MRSVAKLIARPDRMVALRSGERTESSAFPGKTWDEDRALPQSRSPMNPGADERIGKNGKI